MAEIFLNRRFFIKYLLGCVLLFSFANLSAQEDGNLIQDRMNQLDKEKVAIKRHFRETRCPYVIRVRNQIEFDRINDEINKGIRIGKKNLKVKIYKGVYTFHPNHILRVNDYLGDVSISFEGHDVIITSDTEYGRDTQLSPWSETQKADDLIDVIDKEKGLCFLPFKNQIDNDDNTVTKIKITKWFYSSVYDIEYIDENGIYFIADNLNYLNKYGRSGYDINYDYLYAGTIPRFRLYDSTKVDHCRASCFLNISNSSYKSLSFSGLLFDGNKSGSALLSINNVNARVVRLNKCSFNNMRSIVADVSNTSNIIVDNNSFSNTTNSVLHFYNGCKNVLVNNNQFDFCGISFKQTFCINCGEADYCILNNIFKDFGYSAIGVGCLRGKKKTEYSGGIIEHNEIYYSNQFLINSWKYTLMDSGAIYTWTQNDKVIIRNNYIHDYTGAGDNRGIFCDDGSSNINIYNNVILNILNSYCIDSRKVIDQTVGYHNNSNNYMASNVLDGSVRFMGYAETDRLCIKGANYIIDNKREELSNNCFEDLSIVAEDLIVKDSNGHFIQKKIKQCVHR